MYRFSYSEILEDAGAQGRARERQALERSVALMLAAEAAGPQSREAVEAIYFVNRLWSFLIEDLAHPDNALPPELRASLISIGISLLGMAQNIRSGELKSFAVMIDISRVVAEALR